MDVKEVYEKVKEEVKKRIAGKEEVIELMFVALIANGHVLLEGVPGVAKTTMAKTLASAIQAKFSRIQGMPDLDIKDIIGYTYISENNEIKLKQGPIFTNILLIDELNRAPPKTASALLEALEERQVTIGDHSLLIPKPFIALATQNPLNIEGTAPLPKVLTDRFLMKIAVGYPTMEEEQTMLRLKERDENIKINSIIDTQGIIEMQKMVNKVSISNEVIEYITRIVNATRKDLHIVMGASPRAEISFMLCGKARALIKGREEVSIEDIKHLARPVLSHRLVVRATGGIGVNGIIDGIIASIH